MPNHTKPQAASDVEDDLASGVRQEIRDLCKRGNITLAEYEVLRCNSWEWDLVYQHLTTEALLVALRHNLRNCTTKASPPTIYEESLCQTLAPEAVKALEAAHAENAELRRMLAMAYCRFGLYGDDGELQDNTTFPFIDFKRDPVKEIEDKMSHRSLLALANAPR